VSAQVLAASGQPGAILTVATSIPSLSALGLNSDAEDELLRRAWELAISRLPPDATGKRASWRSFLFVLPGSAELARNAGRDVFSALREDRQIARVAWRVIATPIGEDWQAAHELAQADAHEQLRPPDLNVAAWVERLPAGPQITRLAGSGNCGRRR
jgi:hypothetical protein